MSEEQRLVVEAFKKGFEKFKDQNIVLYGIGKNTEAILEAVSGFSIPGLMDAKTVGQFFYGKKVLSEEEVVNLNPIIAIIARDSVVNIIYERIKHLYLKNGIRIFDFSGQVLAGKKQIFRNGNLPYWECSLDELYSEIDRHDRISFDVFDTLVTRKVLEPEDVFVLVEERSALKGSVPFHVMRKQAENSLDGSPSLEEIYANMKKLYRLTEKDVTYWKEQEILIDQQLTIPRETMQKAFLYAKSQKKEIFLLSDMYYSKEQMQEILQKCGISGYDQLLISSVEKASKEDGELYRKCIVMYGNNTWLHIGDNRRSDIEEAKKEGIDSYHIYSGYEMLMASSLQMLAAHIEPFQRRIMLGLFVSKAFNDPFRLCRTNGVLSIDDLNELGYLFIAPMLTEFTRWMLRFASEKGYEQILFPSRDGYVIQKLYQLMGKGTKQYIEDNCYFRASRRSVSVAALEKEEDIFFIADRKFSGTNQELLAKRFGVMPDDVDEEFVKEQGESNTGDFLEKYKSEIIREAEEERETYRSYLNAKGLLNNKKQLIFDFVAGGTVQFYLSKIMKKTLHGCYFATMNLPNQMYKSEEFIDAPFGNISSYGVKNNLGRYYLFLETILTDGCSTFIKIDKNGEEVYETGDNSVVIWKMIEQVQKGIFSYANDMKQLAVDAPVELAFADELYGVMFGECVKVDNSIKKIFYNDDCYDGVERYPVWMP